MRYWKWLLIAVSVVFLASVFSCSSAQIPISPDKQGEFDLSNTAPILALEMKEGIFDEIGLLGAYELLINPSGKEAELLPRRTSTIGESFIVSGMSFFTNSPWMGNCLSLSGIKMTNEGIGLTFSIIHPFHLSDPHSPSWCPVRLDLDVFDLAMVVVPISGTPTSFPASSVSVYTDVLASPDGYTTELANLIGDDAAMPYALVVDNSEMPSPHTWNKFGMGDDERTFDVIFRPHPGVSLNFDLYLTMGYGASAKKATRLIPKYYNPEFNRKAAWKMEIPPTAPWLDIQPLPVNVRVKVYDWQVGATVYANPDDFKNAPADNVYASSEVDHVAIDIPGMTPIPAMTNTPTSGSGMPDDPLIYDIPVPNALLAPPGTYQGLAIAYDVRTPLPSGTSTRDFLIHTPDGFNTVPYEIPAYCTYQTFTATVVHQGISLSQVNYSVGPSPDDPISVDNSSSGNVDIGFIGKADPQFFNLNYNGDWAIQNVPLLSVYGETVPCCITIQFDLGVPDGVDVTEALVGWSLEPVPSAGPPVFNGFVAVGDRDVNMYSGFDGLFLGVFVPPNPFSGFAALFPNGIAIRGGPYYNQECDPDMCVPTAVSNSLKYLHDKNGNPPDGKATDPESLKKACGMENRSTAPADWGTTKGTYMTDNGYNVNTTGIPPTNSYSHDATAEECDQALAAVQQGKDVEMNTRYHCAQVVAMAKLADGSYLITLCHDTDQEHPGGCMMQAVRYNPNGTPPYVDGGNQLVAGQALNGFISEGP